MTLVLIISALLTDEFLGTSLVISSTFKPIGVKFYIILYFMLNNS